MPKIIHKVEISKAHAKRLRALDRQNGKCCICGHYVPFAPTAPNLFKATWEHVVPMSKGGAPGAKNKKIAHNICNALRGDRPYEDLYKYNVYRYILWCFENNEVPIRGKIKWLRKRPGFFDFENIPHNKKAREPMSLKWVDKTQHLVNVLMKRIA